MHQSYTLFSERSGKMEEANHKLENIISNVDEQINQAEKMLSALQMPPAMLMSKSVKTEVL